MIENPELLTAVLAAPDDDAPRLAYADWLRQNGARDRAELITLQCEIARTIADYVPPAASAVAREAVLHAALRASLTDAVRPIVLRAWLERGFVERVWLEPAALARSLELALASAPVRHVHLVSATGGWAEDLLDAPFDRVVSFDLSEAAIDDGDLAASLAEGSHVLAVRALAFGRKPLSAPDLDRLAGAAFARLHSLTVGVRSDAAVAPLFRSAAVARLERLAVSVADSVDAVAVALADSSPMNRLVSLMLDGTLGDEGAVALSGAGHLAPLRSLRVTAVALGEAGLAALGEMPFLSSLAQLELPRATARPASPRDVMPLLSSLHLTSLRHLDLSGHPLDGEGVEALVAPRFATLRRLVLRGCSLSSDHEKTLRRRFGRGVCVFGQSTP